MREETDTTEAPHVLRDGTTLAGQRIGCLRQAERDVVPIVGADFDGVDQEHAIDDTRRCRQTGRVAMVGEDDEVQPGRRRRRSNRLGCPAAVRLRAVYVIGATPQGWLAGGGERTRVRWPR